MALVILFYWPNTKQMPLEEVAALFGDEVEHSIEQSYQSQEVLSVHNAPTTYAEKDYASQKCTPSQQS